MAVTAGSYEIKNYNCNGVLTEFDFPWRIFGEEDLVVKVYDLDGNETTLALTTGFTAAKSGNDWSSGGSITTIVAYPSGYTLSIERETEHKQPADYVANDNFDAETHEKVVDRSRMIDQEHAKLISRSIKAPADDPALDMTVPVKDQRKERYLWFDADGKPTAAGQSLLGSVTVTGFAETFLDDVDAEAVCDTIGALDVNNDTLADVPGDLDDIADGATYKKLADVNANSHPSEIDDNTVFENAVTRYYSVSLTGYSQSEHTIFGGIQVYADDNTTGILPVNLPDGAIVTNLYSYALIGEGTYKVYLKRSPKTDNSDNVMATNDHVATGALNDSTIDGATIDNTAYTYFIRVMRTGWISLINRIFGIVITYTITEPKP